MLDCERKLKMYKMNGTSLDITKINIEKLKELFPNVVTEGKIDFDMLRTVLGDEVDDSREKYQFTWHGKTASIKLAQTPSTATLRPDKESSKNWDTTENLYIEGDNLEVLKQLQKTYFGKVKMIYIDPPYNTGEDFVYHDDFKNSIGKYKEQTNQTSTSNPESNGRFHTDWLNMMYPRLSLARNLLTEDGVIFISIDDKEQSNLKKISDDIFGTVNFVECLIWKKRATPPNDKCIGRIHEYILCYAKNINKLKLGLLPRDQKSIERYTNPDNDIRGPWVASDLSANGKGGRLVQSCIYPITNPNNGKIYYPSEGRCWLFNKEKMDQWINNGRVSFREQTGAPFLKRYLSEVRQGLTLPTILSEFGFSQTSAAEGDSIFGKKGIFEYAKPTSLIEALVRVGAPDGDSIILDFFSGSATTANAVIQLSAKDGNHRNFIMVQLPELCDEHTAAFKAGYKNICEIGKERIRRAGEQIKAEWEKEHPSDSLFSDEEKFTTDIGFKVFKLDSTNINPWDSEIEIDENALFNYEDVFKDDRSKEDVLYEIMLKYGIFDMPVENIDANGKTMFRIGKRYMIVCLEDSITKEDVTAIADLSPKVVVFKESGFKDDNDKINAEYNLNKAGVEDVKCI